MKIFEKKYFEMLAVHLILIHLVYSISIGLGYVKLDQYLAYI